MTNNKKKYAFWLTPEAKKMIEINAPLANCGSQSEFVEKAVRFYDGYLKVQNAGAFLPHAVADVLEGSLGVFENRMAKLLFNLAVEHNITNHLLAADVDMTREEYNKLRGGSVREVTSTRGAISLKDVIQEGYHQLTRANAVLTGRNAPIQRQAPWQSTSIPCGPFLVWTHFCSGQTASHLSAMVFRVIFGF